MSEKKITYFSGANTSKGFMSFFSELYNPYDGWRAFILKGGPGTGKSSLMRKIAEALEQSGEKAEYIICSSDPDSLDGVVFNDLKVCVVDGTPPHVMEPLYPGAVEQIINLGEYWNCEKLVPFSDKIIETGRQVKNCHARCIGFLKAANSLKSDAEKMAAECADFDKLSAYASRFAAREFGAGRGRIGKETKRFLSAVTPRGVFVNYESVEECSSVAVIYDEYGAVSDKLLKLLRAYSLGAGLDTVVCFCPVNPEKIEHLIIPEIGLCVFTANSYHPAPVNASRKIHSRRFIDSEKLRSHKHRLNFDLKASSELIDEAVNMLVSAKKYHDELEGYYIPAMDFEKVDEEAGKIINCIMKIKEA